MSVSIEYFGKLDIRVGKIVEVEEIPQARKPLYRFRIEFGPTIGMKQCVGGIKTFYSKEQLMGKLVAAIVNLESKPIAGVISECMMLASFNESDLALLTPDRPMPPGTRVA